MEGHVQDQVTKGLRLLYEHPPPSCPPREDSSRVASCPMERPTWQGVDVPSQQPARTGGLLTAT